MRNMGGWKSRKINKRNKGSQTPGKAKGDSCKADSMSRYFAKRSRAYKHPDYGVWCDQKDRMNQHG